MADVVNIGTRAYDVRRADEFLPYTKVIINVSNESNELVSYIADDGIEGATLEFDCPWGTQAMANAILARVRGLQYQPFTATSALADPAVELGDAVSVNGIYSGIYTQDATFSHTFYTDISAPQDEQLENEYAVKSKTERMVARQMAYMKATFAVYNDAISACVAKEGGNGENSFSWKLLNTKFTLSSTIDGKKVDVFTCNASGITINGKIVAKNGKIGASLGSDGKWTGGFDIGADKITNGQTTLGSTSQKDGVYIGVDGIGLGNGRFKVTKAGSLYAKGEIVATAGYIGGDTGFKIGSTYIANGTKKLNIGDGDGEERIFIGTSGISLGKTTVNVKNKKTGQVEEQVKPAFKVSNKGYMEVYSGKFYGTVYASKITFTNPDGSTTTLDGSKLTDSSVADGKISGVSGGKINDASIPKAKLNSSTQNNITHGQSAYDTIDSLFAGRITADFIKGKEVYAENRLWVGNGNSALIASWQERVIMGQTIKYLGRS